MGSGWAIGPIAPTWEIADETVGLAVEAMGPDLLLSDGQQHRGTSNNCRTGSCCFVG